MINIPPEKTTQSNTPNVLFFLSAHRYHIIGCLFVDAEKRSRPGASAPGCCYIVFSWRIAFTAAPRVVKQDVVTPRLLCAVYTRPAPTNNGHIMGLFGRWLQHVGELPPPGRRCTCISCTHNAWRVTIEHRYLHVRRSGPKYRIEKQIHGNPAVRMGKRDWRDRGSVCCARRFDRYGCGESERLGSWRNDRSEIKARRGI